MFTSQYNKLVSYILNKAYQHNQNPESSLNAIASSLTLSLGLITGNCLQETTDSKIPWSVQRDRERERTIFSTSFIS